MAQPLWLRIEGARQNNLKNVTLAIPHDRAKTISLVYQSGFVTARTIDHGRVVLTAQIPREVAGELKPYVVEDH